MGEFWVLGGQPGGGRDGGAAEAGGGPPPASALCCVLTGLRLSPALGCCVQPCPARSLFFPVPVTPSLVIPKAIRSDRTWRRQDLQPGWGSWVASFPIARRRGHLGVPRSPLPAALVLGGGDKPSAWGIRPGPRQRSPLTLVGLGKALAHEDQTESGPAWEGCPGRLRGSGAGPGPAQAHGGAVSRGTRAARM